MNVRKVNNFFELDKFKSLSLEKKSLVIGLTALSSVTIVGIIAAPFVWKIATNCLANKKIKRLPSIGDSVGSAFPTGVGRKDHAEKRPSTDAPVVGNGLSPTASEPDARIQEESETEKEPENKEEIPAAPQQQPSSPVVIQDDDERAASGDRKDEKQPVEDSRKDDTEQSSAAAGLRNKSQSHSFQLRRGIAQFFSMKKADELASMMQVKYGESLDKMTIDVGEGKPPLVVLVKKIGSSYYRYLLAKNKKAYGYSIPLTEAQITTMLKTTQLPEFSISSTEINLCLSSGFFLFNKEGDGHTNYMVNDRGKIERLNEQNDGIIPTLQELNKMYESKLYSIN